MRQEKISNENGGERRTVNGEHKPQTPAVTDSTCTDYTTTTMEFLTSLLFKTRNAESESLYKDEIQETEKNLCADTTPVTGANNNNIKKVVEDIKVLKERTKYGILRCDYEYIPTRGMI